LRPSLRQKESKEHAQINTKNKGKKHTTESNGSLLKSKYKKFGKESS